MVADLADAVHAAHQAGIVHCDLKPGNVLLLAPRGQPKITDFGLAKFLASSEDLGPDLHTASGELLGTPAYMAPEQLASRRPEVTPRTDVYALGAILYEMLTGRPPFQGASRLDTLEQVRHQVPVPPRLLVPRIPEAVEKICLKCLSKQPHQRYPSAAALASELHRCIEKEAPNGLPTGDAPPGKRRVAVLVDVLFVTLLFLAIASVILGLIFEPRPGTVNNGIYVSARSLFWASNVVRVDGDSPSPRSTTAPASSSSVPERDPMLDNLQALAAIPVLAGAWYLTRRYRRRR
jgi:serine/threonine protein kinase